MKRRCGNCLFHTPNGETQVFCFGVPPIPIDVQVAEDGKRNIQQQMPLLPKDRPGCALHRYRFSLRRLTNATS